MVHRRVTAGTLLTAGATAALLVAATAPASAHHRDGHTGGPGSNCPNPQNAYPPGQCNPPRASVNDNTLRRGQTFRYRAQGFAPGSRVLVSQFTAAQPPAPATPDGFTFFDIPLTVPADAALGVHYLTSRGPAAAGVTPPSGLRASSQQGLSQQAAEQQLLELTVPVRVTAEDGDDQGDDVSGGDDGGGTGGGAGSGLPRTGQQIAAAAFLGTALTAAGALAVRTGRRRRRDATA